MVVKLNQEEWTVKETDMDAMDPPPRPMSITVTTLEQRRIPLEVPWTTKVEAVQAMIEQDHGIPAARQRLLFNREPLFDDWTLQRCGVEDGADLGLVLRLADSTTQAPRWLRMLEDPARYPLHAAAQDGRLTDLIANLRAKQVEGTIAAGTPLSRTPNFPALLTRVLCRQRLRSGTVRGGTTRRLTARRCVHSWMAWRRMARGCSSWPAPTLWLKTATGTRPSTTQR